MKSTHVELEQKFGLAEGESVSDFQQLGESNPSLCVLCLCPITYLIVMGFITSTHINSLVFKLGPT